MGMLSDWSWFASSTFTSFFMSFARHLEFISKVEPEERGHREGGSCLIAPPDREFVLPSPGALKSTKQKVLNLEISNPTKRWKGDTFLPSSLLNRVSRSIHVPEPLKSCGASVAKGRLRVHSVHSIGSSTLKTWRKSRWAEWYGWWNKSCTTWEAPNDLDSGEQPWKNNIWGILSGF